MAIRKVFGADKLKVLLLAIWKFMRFVMLASLIGSPLVWSIMSRWLSIFPHRIEITVGVLVITGAISIVVSLITVFWQSNRLANCNPVKIIRH